MVVASPFRSQPSDLSDFVRITLEDGLSHPTVWDIAQDKYGYMWFATQNGLNRYDGYQCTVYRLDQPDSLGVGNGIVRTCYADSSGEIWVGTDDGLAYYNCDLDKFEYFSSWEGGEKMSVHGIAELDENELLIFSNGKKLKIFDRKSLRFLVPENGLADIVSPSSVSSQGDEVYIGSDEGVYIYSISRKTLDFIPVKIEKNRRKLVFVRQRPDFLWIGTEGGGLIRYDFRTERTKTYVHNPAVKGSISSNYVRSLALDHQERLWVGTLNSLNIYDAHNDNFRVCHDDTVEPENSLQLSIRKIYRDVQGGMWLGTYQRGVGYFHPLRKQFENMNPRPGANALNVNVVNCIEGDSEGNLWIGTNGGGLNCYNLQTRKFSYYTLKDGLYSNDVKNVFIDEKAGLVYITCHAGGISVLHRNTGRVERIVVPNMRNPYDIEPSKNGMFWISSMRSLHLFDSRDRSFRSIKPFADGSKLPIKRLASMFRDSKGRLWLLCEKKLLVCEEEDGRLRDCQLTVLHDVERNFVNCVHESSDGIFWIGTRNGIFYFDEGKNEIRHYSEQDGLADNVVHSILEDSDGTLWMGTDRGLCHFYPQTGKFRNYTVADGLQSNLFTSACFLSPDGRMYFGGVSGVVSFSPESLTDNPYAPDPIIRNLKLFGKTVLPGDETGILHTNVNETERITLASRQSMFSLDFVVPNYVAGGHNLYAYMLEGYDKDWHFTGDVRSVSYSNLPHGTYRFRLKAANNDRKWSENETSLEIKVLPVWYRTWWAYLLFFTAFVCVAAGVFRYVWMRKSMRMQLEAERLDKEREREVHEMKQRFFIDISHELRTPLTLIVSPVQDLLRKVYDRPVRRQLELIERNVSRLLHLINQLMDYRRAELGVFRLKVKQTDVHELVKSIYFYYEEAARDKGVRYNMYSEVEGQSFLCDASYVELILNNLISNALKYTSEGDSVLVSLKKEENNLLLQVEDSGCGIPSAKQSKVFERFYQADAGHLGAGIGLSLVKRLVDLHHGRIELHSEEGKGSRFSVYLPQESSVYSDEEMTPGGEFVHTVNEKRMYLSDIQNADKADEPADEVLPDNDDEQEKETVLVVEDDKDINRYLCVNLEKEYHVLKAFNGNEALEMLNGDRHVDLVLTDVIMPLVNGIQLCKMIKQNINTSHIPVIILSAKAECDEQLEGLEVGADDYIAKPFSMAVVTAKIKNLFRTRRQAVAYYNQSHEVDIAKVALNPLDGEFLQRAVSVVEKHLDECEFSVEDLSREMFVNRVSLNNKIKALTGGTTRDFIRKIRLDKAAGMLKEGRFSVSEVSAFVGFNTVSYFAHCFKKQFGCLPSEYKGK